MYNNSMYSLNVPDFEDEYLPVSCYNCDIEDCEGVPTLLLEVL